MTARFRDAVLPGDLAVLTRFMAGLQDLEHALHPGRQTGADGAEAHVVYLAGEIAAKQGRMIMAETAAGEPIAMMVCVVEDIGGHFLYPESRVVGYIYDLWIEPEYRGGDLLDRLIALAEAHFKALGLSLLMLSYLVGNDRARMAYEKRGFVPNEVLMERPIE